MCQKCFPVFKNFEINQNYELEVLRKIINGQLIGKSAETLLILFEQCCDYVKAEFIKAEQIEISSDGSS